MCDICKVIPGICNARLVPFIYFRASALRITFLCSANGQIEMSLRFVLCIGRLSKSSFKQPSLWKKWKKMS